MAAAARPDLHDVWEGENDGWWTDYPPPPGFEGEEEGRYGEDNYCRRLAPDERAALDDTHAAIDAEARAHAEAQRLHFFFGSKPG